MDTSMKALFLCSTIVLSGCNGATDVMQCRKSVEEEFSPFADIRAVPRNRYEFIVVEGNAVWYVETKNLTNANVSRKDKLMNLPCEPDGVFMPLPAEDSP